MAQLEERQSSSNWIKSMRLRSSKLGACAARSPAD